MNIGENISAARIHFGLSQYQLSKRMNVSKATISLWENNKKYPTRKNIEKMSELFGIKPQDMFNEDLNLKLDSQPGLPFRPKTFNIKSGVQLVIQEESLSEEELHSVDKVCDILKVFFKSGK